MKTPRFIRTLILLFCIFLGATPLAAEGVAVTGGRWMVETSLFTLMNLAPDPADFYHLSVGYEFDERSALYLGATTWKYDAPLGIPYGPSWESEDERYPGYVRAFGLGLEYRRYVWKGLYASLAAMPFLQNYHASGGRLIGSGFQLFIQAQAGYRFDLFGGKLYLRPGVSFNYWPVNTNLPEGFEARERDWPSYFLFEPALYIGIRL